MQYKRKVLKILLITCVAFYVVAILLITWDGLTDEIQAADVAIVFGNTVNSNGEPAPRLRARLDKAYEIYQTEIIEKIVVSGGIGKEGVDEAQAMKDYLVGKDISEDDIIVDSKGNDTFSTAKNLFQFMSENDTSSAIVVTQFFHVPRAKLALQRFGIQFIYSAHADYFELRDIYSTMREVIAYGYYFVRSYQ
jgi:vancomycin permeability regulator SanA